MPQQVDVEAIVRGGGDARDACETQFAVAQPPAPDDPDFPPESVVVPVGDDGLDWADVGAAAYDRDDSTKGSTNPKAQAQQWQHAKPRSSSHRFSGGIQAKHPIIGLPGKVQQHSSYLGRSGHRPARVPIFPKKPPVPGAARGRKSTVPEQEPGSPTVSCIGKVLSETEQSRYPKRRRQSPEKEKMKRVEPTGFWASVTATFCCGGEESTATETMPGDTPGEAAGERRIAAKPATEPPALGAMRRFASGRRPLPLDRDAPARDWRRSVGSVEDAWRERDRDRDWDASAWFDGADGNMLKSRNGMW
ncbi:unnamed protein product [Musa acuminata subsp. malaccensis]|uniref:(wild Malaysian banana) hypothetical protein n=1 Tax=Musa acuminata subsp. malaccensis TaxID=214687 RepID=A0A804KS26_MUSAM|nr:PREDICTED: uncharacterized protein LOC103973591 [Musa acuminata subsp. malaccensis]CAG1838863.1 unnamed protein product [Musa acuminata subsp. malaccensis]